MMLTMRPLKGESFQVDVDPESKVIDLKNKIAEMKPEYPAAQQKLIYSGKILGDDSVIKTLDIKADGFIVIMVAKAAAPAAESSAQPSAQPSAAPTTPTPQPAATPAAAAPGSPTQPSGTGAAAGAPEPNLPQVILDLKRSPRFRVLAMVVAQRPQTLNQMLPALRQQWPQLLVAIRDNLEGFVGWCRQEAAGQAMLAAVSGNNPNIPPELAQAIQQNPQAFAAMLQRAGAGGGLPGGLPGGLGGGEEGAGGPEASPEDEQAIERLVALGFNRAMAAQAYFACEKNEQAAANLLLSGGDDDDMQT